MLKLWTECQDTANVVTEVTTLAVSEATTSKQQVWTGGLGPQNVYHVYHVSALEKYHGTVTETARNSRVRFVVKQMGKCTPPNVKRCIIWRVMTFHPSVFVSVPGYTVVSSFLKLFCLNELCLFNSLVWLGSFVSVWEHWLKHKRRQYTPVRNWTAVLARLKSIHTALYG